MEISGLSLLSATAPADTEASSERWHHMINSPQVGDLNELLPPNIYDRAGDSGVLYVQTAKKRFTTGIAFSRSSSVLLGSAIFSARLLMVLGEGLL